MSNIFLDFAFFPQVRSDAKVGQFWPMDSGSDTSALLGRSGLEPSPAPFGQEAGPRTSFQLITG